MDAAEPDIVGSLLSTIAHDIRTPLGTLAIVTARLQRTGAPEDVRDDAAVLARGIVHIEAVLRNVVDCSKLRAGTLSLDLEQVDLVVLLARVVDEARASHPEGVVGLDVAGDGSLVVSADRARLERALETLVRDAVKGGHGSRNVLVRAERESAQVRITVEHDGDGYTHEGLGAMFAPPWAPNARRAALSLYVCRGIVEAHGGRIGIESECGCGATFTITLPRDHRACG